MSATSDGGGAAPPVFDPSNLRALADFVGADKARGYVADFVGQAGDYRVKIRDALAAGDLDTVHRLAHQLKSTAGTVGAHEAADAADRLQLAARDGGPVEAALAERLEAALDRAIAAVRLEDGDG